jgi:hypothetical protein
MRTPHATAAFKETPLVYPSGPHGLLNVRVCVVLPLCSHDVFPAGFWRSQLHVPLMMERQLGVVGKGTKDRRYPFSPLFGSHENSTPTALR